MAEKKPDASVTMVSVTQFAALVELTVQRVYQLCQQERSPRPTFRSRIRSARGCMTGAVR